MEAKNLQTQKGFTLVEIAIVLVIIGLLLGGVLKGQELIENSKIKSVTQDFDGISAAYYAYQDRTGRIPGDTDNNGIIEDAETAGGFWADLREEGFIKGENVSTNVSGPVHALDGVFTVHSGSTTSDPVTGFNKNYICASNIDDTVAQGLDIKLDDGVFDSGIIRAEEAYNTDTDPDLICREL